MAAGAGANGFDYLAGRFRNIHDRTISEFFRNSVNGRPPAVTAADGLETVRVMGVISQQLQCQGAGMDSPLDSGPNNASGPSRMR